MSIPVRRKSRGRPATGTDPLVAVRFAREMIDAIDRAATDRGVSRSEVIREAVTGWLREKGYLRTSAA